MNYYVLQHHLIINLGYEIKKDKLKYGGLRRYVLVKNLYVNNK